MQVNQVGSMFDTKGTGETINSLEEPGQGLTIVNKEDDKLEGYVL
jgi:hypothetical protein